MALSQNVSDQSQLPDSDQRASLQRRVLTVLFGASILGRASVSLSFTVATLVMKDLMDNERFAGLASVALTAGTALSAGILSKMMARRGRNVGLTTGLAIAMVGAGVCTVAIQQENLLLFLAGMVGLGWGGGTINLGRYAASDLATPESRGKAISIVVFAATIGSVFGPLAVGPSGRWMENAGWPEKAGPFAISVALLGVAALFVFLFLRPDPLEFIGGLERQQETKVEKRSIRASMALAWRLPMARVAVVTLVISQAVMVMIMTMTPLHMDAHGHGVGVIGWVISAHTAGMYAFAPLAGWASDKYGRIPSIAFGAVVLLASTVMTALAASAPNALMFPGLYLLGLGWSFGMVAGSALLTESVTPEERVSVQGAVDVTTAVVSGVGAFGSGLVFDMAGFHVLSLIGTCAAGALFVTAYFRSRLNASMGSVAA